MQLRLLSAVTTITIVAASLPVAAVPPYSPSTTTVAILPVVNTAKMRHPDKDAPARAKQSEEGLKALTSDFMEHGFKVVDQEGVDSATQAAGVDLTKEDERTAQNLVKVGKAVHADLTLLLVITDTHQGFRHGLLVMGGQREGEAKTKLWLVDTKSGSAVIDGADAAGKSQASAMQGWITGGIGEGSSQYVIKAVDDAVDKSLHDFMAQYSTIPKT